MEIFGGADQEFFFIFSRSIRRVIFYSIIKPVMNEKGEREMDIISTSQALQIAGRAGRYGTQYEKVNNSSLPPASKCLTGRFEFGIWTFSSYNFLFFSGVGDNIQGRGFANTG